MLHGDLWMTKGYNLHYKQQKAFPIIMSRADMEQLC